MLAYMLLHLRLSLVPYGYNCIATNFTTSAQWAIWTHFSNSNPEFFKLLKNVCERKRNPRPACGNNFSGFRNTPGKSSRKCLTARVK